MIEKSLRQCLVSGNGKVKIHASISSYFVTITEIIAQCCYKIAKFEQYVT